MSKNKPNNPQLWERAKQEARKKFSVYPSAYANAWAAKWYKERNGTWSKSTAIKKDLREWFGEKWVNLAKPIRENGKIVDYEPCGRKSSVTTDEKYPKCLPKKRAMALSDSERSTLIQRKRTTGNPIDGKPTMTSNKIKNIKKNSVIDSFIDNMSEQDIDEVINSLSNPYLGNINNPQYMPELSMQPKLRNLLSEWDDEKKKSKKLNDYLYQGMLFPTSSPRMKNEKPIENIYYGKPDKIAGMGIKKSLGKHKNKYFKN